jgi:CheY-like chemotaxis protein
MSERAKPFDLGEVLTDVARRHVAAAHDRGLVLLYDYEGSLATVDAPRHELSELLDHALRHALGRCARAYVLFSAQVQCDAHGRCHASMRIVSNAAEAGEAVAPAELMRFPGVAWEQFSQRAGARSTITGRSAVLNAELSIAALAHEGELIRIDAAWPVLDPGRSERSADAHGARAWLVAQPLLALSTLARRLQRQGWATTSFATLEELRAALHGNRGTPPSLLIGLDTGRVDAQEFAQAASELPSDALAVFATDASPNAPRDLPGCECWAQPFSPAELLELTERQGRAAARPRTGRTVPAALTQEDRRTVLVVDDNAVNQMLAKEMLQLLGFDVALADDGLQAVEHCRKHCPHAVLMDLQMPRMDGLKATGELRRLQRKGAIAHFPIIAITADGTARDACAAAGMDAFMTKPIDLHELERLLKQALP